MSNPRLENWYIIDDRIVGQVCGHPVFADGETVSTSRVAALDKERGVAVTTYSKYDLGKPAVEETK